MNRGGVIDITIDGVRMNIVQPENPVKPATLNLRHTADGATSRTTMAGSTGTSHGDTGAALRAFGGWRLAGGATFVLGMILLGWRAVPNLLAVAVCGSGLGLGTLSYVIPTYGAAIALIGLLGSLAAFFAWLHGLKTNPNKDPHVAQSKVLRRLLKR